MEVDAAGNEIHPEDAVDTSEDDHFEEATEWATSDSSEESSAVPPIHNIRLQKRIGRVKAELSRVADTLRTLKLNHDQSSNLDVLYQSTCELSMFEYPKTRIVGFIGESGVGMV